MNDSRCVKGWSKPDPGRYSGFDLTGLSIRADGL